jgi:hypothetical protein
MDELHRMFAETPARSGRADLGEDELAEIVQCELIPRCAASLLEELKQRAPDMLREHREIDEGFRSRHLERWAEGFDLLDMLLVVAEETGAAINNTDRPQAAEDDDVQFEAVITLHARAVLVTREILCLLKGGFADGALGRWRTLHEVAVVAEFLAKHNQGISERYLLHREVQAYRAMRQYCKYQKRANLEPLMKTMYAH